MLRIVYSYILLVFTFSTLEAQVNFASERLADLYATLPSDCKKNIDSKHSDSIFLCSCNLLGKEINLINCTEDSVITHIGIKFVNNNERLNYPAHLIEFFERTVLENIIYPFDSKWLKINKENSIKLITNGIESIYNSSTLLLNTIPQLLDSTEIYFSKVQKNSVIKIEKNKHSIEIQFPTKFSSLSAMDKKEYGDYLFNKLSNFTIKDSIQYCQANDLQLIPFGKEMWKNCGMDYSELFFSDTYFYLKDSVNFEPVFSNEHVYESFFNTFLLKGKHNSNFKIDIEFQLYNQKKSAEINLLDFLSYFEKDFNLYFSILKIDEKIMEGVLLIQNKHFNYINLLNIKAEKNKFFDYNENLKCKFFFNIPTDNIKNLFAND
jgi:hypothetical protein